MNEKSSVGMKRRVASSLLFIFWSLAFMSGVKSNLLESSVIYPDAIRGFPYPYMTDIEYYIFLPGFMSILNLAMVFFSSKIPKSLAMILSIGQILLIVFLFILGGGGV